MAEEQDQAYMRKKLLLRMPEELYEEIRKAAYDLNVTKAEICRRGIELYLEKRRNKTTKKK